MFSKSHFLATCLSCFFVVAFLGHHSTQAQESKWYDKKTKWNGYDQFHFKVANKSAYLVAPKKTASGKPWVWRARFPNFHAEMDIELLAKGFHIAYVDVAGLFGSPQAVEVGNRLYEKMVSEQGLANKVVLEGVSRGGLFVYNWAATNPTRVACIYCDTPVCDIRSWPGGKGSGVGADAEWKQCLGVYELTESDAESFTGNPIDHFQTIADAKIPIMHIVSENDQVVPPSENTYVLKSRLDKIGHPMRLISVEKGTDRSRGHHFTHPNPNQVVDFILKQTLVFPKRRKLLDDSSRIVFLGDSITYSGQYVADFETWMRANHLATDSTLINVGLPSETVSGLSEEGHAGGRFPRPDLFERLDRVLEKTVPDLVFACYGINCGIYQPLDETRFAKFQKGIERLKERVEASGSKIIFITPPTHDDSRSKKDFSYDAVMTHYSNWLNSRRKDGWQVIDLHTAMAEELANRRTSDPEFTFQPDSVHPNANGHWLIASQLIAWFGGEVEKATSSKQLLRNSGTPLELGALIQQRSGMLRDSYLSESKHLRPGIREGIPADQAIDNAKTIAQKIKQILADH